MIWNALKIALLLALVFLTYSYFNAKHQYDQGLQKFMDPSRESIVAELNYNLGIDLSDDAIVILARRSEPHPFFGEYRGCLIVHVEADDWQKVSEVFEDAEYSDLQFNCPENDLFVAEAENYDLTHVGQLRPESDEHYQLLSAEDDGILVFKTSIH